MSRRGRLALAGALALALAGRAAAAGEDLEVSVGERLGTTTTLVAGRPVLLQATVFTDYSSPGCTIGELGKGAPLTFTVTLPAGVALRDGASPTATVPLTARAAVTASWPVRVARPGRYHGSVVVQATAPGGRTCSGHQRFRVFAARSGPRLRVAGGFLFAHDVQLAVVARLPGLPRDALGEAIADAMDEHHSPGGADSGRSELDLVTASFRGRPLLVTSASEFGGDGVACITYARPAGLRQPRVRYGLHFGWNREKGLQPVHRSGWARLHRRPANAAERACAVQNGYAGIGR